MCKEGRVVVSIIDIIPFGLFLLDVPCGYSWLYKVIEPKVVKGFLSLNRADGRLIGKLLK